MILIGELSLWVALLMAAWAGVTSFAGGALRRDDLVNSGRRGLYVTCAMVILASIVLSSGVPNEASTMSRLSMFEPSPPG